jgi:hypothetical protein
LFENRVLRKIFGPKRDKLTGEWRRLRIGKLYAMWTKYDSGDKIKKNYLGGACGT